MANYIKYAVRVDDEEQADIVTAYLADYPFESFEVEGDELCAYIPKEALDECRTDIEQQLADYTFSAEEIVTQNWNALWESDFQQVEVADKVLIRAPFHAPRPDYGGMEVIIQPKMSFGTGHHATTQMMVEMLLGADVEGREVLDMGSGTGVLAIVAAKLGAKSVLAVEIDDMAEESVRENIALNGVLECVESVCSDVRAIEGRKFDTILANINRNILLNDMAAYCATLRQGGRLFISGFLAEDVAILVDYAATLNLAKREHISNGEWQCLGFEVA